MMTTYLVEQGLKSCKLQPSKPVSMSLSSWCRGSKDGDNCMFVPLNAQASSIEMLRGVAIDSGNDASKALAEHIGGSESEFVGMMNAEAEKLGMTYPILKIRLNCPTRAIGPRHANSPFSRQAIIRNCADYYPICAERECTYNDIKHGNRNALRYTDPTVDGLKTGHMEEA